MGLRIRKGKKERERVEREKTFKLKDNLGLISGVVSNKILSYKKAYSIGISRLHCYNIFPTDAP